MSYATPACSPVEVGWVMNMLLVLLMFYFGVVTLWAAPRLYQLLRARWRAARKPGGGGAVTIRRTMVIRHKAAGE